MNMIRHQTVYPDLSIISLAPSGHELLVKRIILLTEKRLLSAVSSLSDMMRIAGYDHSRYSRHPYLPLIPTVYHHIKTSMVSPDFQGVVRCQIMSYVSAPLEIPDLLLYKRSM
jgi:hypothetical protein